MITVTRLNGKRLTVNALLIETIEATPDTMIALTTGKKITVLETLPDVVGLVQLYMQQIGSIKGSVHSVVKEDDE